MAQKELITNENYSSLLKDIKSIMQKGLVKAYKAVDNIKVQTYWQVGERIVREEIDNDRADYGQEIIKKISIDLKIHERTLYRILKFYRTYPILTTVLSELSWSHYLLLMEIDNFEQRKFYEIQSVKESWSVRELSKRLNNNEFEKAKKKGEITISLPIQLPSPEEVFKDNYNWDFISLDEKHSEKQLENALLDNIQKVLLEFGAGFAFMARQQKVLINNQWHNIDLLFYHVLLKCYIIVELKARELRQGDIEQV
ncbi:MAG: PDDEXK nuclease domain-containing protein [Nanoarchaeota archaeon]|nr:PDDEXK nuclease domain-containing protein [Nanoarchaeota archaeon]